MLFSNNSWSGCRRHGPVGSLVLCLQFGCHRREAGALPAKMQISQRRDVCGTKHLALTRSSVQQLASTVRSRPPHRVRCATSHLLQFRKQIAAIASVEKPSQGTLSVGSNSRRARDKNNHASSCQPVARRWSDCGKRTERGRLVAISAWSCAKSANCSVLRSVKAVKEPASSTGAHQEPASSAQSSS